MKKLIPVLLIIALLCNYVNAQTCPPINVSPNTTLCGGGCVTLSVSSANDPNYFYAWQPGSSAGSAFTVCPTVTTSYTVVATDLNTGCTVTASVTIIVLPATPVNVSGTPSVVCLGGCANLNVSSSNDPNYFYTWAPGGTGGLNTAMGSSVIACPVSTTTYTVTATDLNTGCVITNTITVTVIPKPQPMIQEGDTAVCDNSPGFYLHVNDLGVYAGGYPPGTTFDWGLGPFMSNTYFVNGSGDYSVMVTLPASLGSCAKISNTVHVTFLQSPIVLLTNSTCCIYSTVFLGSPSYTFLWNTSEFTDHICPVAPGNYTITVTDLNGCTGTESIVAAPCPPLEAFVHYNNCTDSACITVTGGCPPYFYAWCNAATSNNQCFANTFLLPCQTCPVTIYDDCGNSVSVVVEKPLISLSSTPASGPGICDASATVNVICFGCTSPGNTYIWSTGQTTQSITGLCCGSTYTVTVTDCYSNAWTCSVTVPPCGPAIHFIDSCNTTICVNISGGTPPYSYYWHTIPVTITPCIDALPCTDVTITVIDASKSSITVTHKKANLTAVITNATCNMANGAIDFSINCIDLNCYPLTYSWSNGTITEDITGLTPGTYCVTVTDACGNEYRCCYKVKCQCTWDGCIKFNVAQGKLTTTSFGPPAAGCSFTYKWTTSSGFNHTGLTWTSVPAFLSVTLKVISCCGDTVIKTYSPLTSPILTKKDPCCNVNDGVITATNISGGSQPCTGYTYTWQRYLTSGIWITIGTGNPLINCSANTKYRLIVQDCCGNSITSSAIIMGPYVPFTVSAIKSNPSDCGGFGLFNGSISFKVSSTCATVYYGYSYMPFPNCPCLPFGISYGQQLLPLNVNLATFNGLAPGTYTFFITRCGITYQLAPVTIHFKKPVINFHFTNCNDNVCIETSACCNTTFNWKLNNVNYGSQVQCRSIGTFPGQLHPGSTYTVIVTDCEGQTAIRSVTIPTIFAVITNSKCQLANGKINVSVSGFGSGLTYLWTPTGQTTKNATGLSVGTHCLTITNKNGDKWQCCYTLTTTPAVTFATLQGPCREKCISVLTGTPLYTYQWKQCGTGIVAGTSACLNMCGCYIVKVTDANSCTAAIVDNIQGVKINDSDSCGLCADVCTAYPCTGYSYLWSNGETRSCIKCLLSGTYTVTVTDCNGITYSCNKAIAVNPFTAQLMSVQQPTGFIKIKVNGGCLPYSCSYSINNGAPASLPLATQYSYTFNIPNYTPNDWYMIDIHDACGHVIPTFKFYARNASDNSALNEQLADPVLAPNPNNGTFSVMFNDTWIDKDVNCMVYDLTGKVIRSEKLSIKNSGAVQFDMSDKSKGVYFIKLSSGNNFWNCKFIVQ